MMKTIRKIKKFVNRKQIPVDFNVTGYWLQETSMEQEIKPI